LLVFPDLTAFAEAKFKARGAPCDSRRPFEERFSMSPQTNLTRRNLLASLVLGAPALLAVSASSALASQQPKKKERHPHIRAAIHELREAKKELETAEHDFGGHRVEAIEAINVALKQLEKALQYSRKTGT
jgi:hypothetical protein